MSRLNETQLAAVKDESNVIVIIAGAGSGKTTVLTKRIEYLYKKKQVHPQAVLAITFTNKAAQEMKERLLQLTGPAAEMSWILTFHAFSVRIIRENIEYLKDFKSNFLIIDEDDKKKIIKKLIQDNDLNDQFTVKEVLYEISNAKTFAKSLAEVEYKVNYLYLQIFKMYRSYLIENNAFDFDDLLLYAHHLLRNKEVNSKYKKRFSHILVDEFQDTSTIQSDMLKLIKDDNCLFVVGDVDQSIYTWRGAVIENMLNLSKDYKDCSIIKLEQNYRSTKKILACANKLIEHNVTRFEKELWTENASGEDVIYKPMSNDGQESYQVCLEIQRKIDHGSELSEIAVLYRSNYQSRKIEENLIQRNIPYVIYGGIRFYERMEIKDILAYLRLIIDNTDLISLSRVINVPKRKAGEKTIRKLENFAAENNLTVFQAIDEIGTQSLIKFADIIKKYSNNFIDNFEDNFDQLLIDIGYEEYLLTQDDHTVVEERMQNIEELKNAITNELKNGKILNEYLSELALFTQTEEDTDDKVILSTIHGVKGLEFDSVYMIGMNEEKFPSARSIGSEEDLEEERRLAYVAVTRAKKSLYMTSSSFSFRGELMAPSRFIEEMELQPSDDWDDFIF